MIYSGDTRYDLRGDHIWWSVNGVEYGNLDYSSRKMQDFRFDYRLDLAQEVGSFEHEVKRALLQLAGRGQKLALCVSGRDSEIIARVAAELGLDAEIYFLKMWSMNEWMLKLTGEVAADTGLRMNVVELSESELMNQVIPETFALLKQYKPTYLSLPYLLANIPDDQLIVLGEGDLNKSHPSFSKFFTRSARGIPMLASEIAYRVWAQSARRFGEYYFYSSTPGLILSAYNDPDLDYSPPSISTDRIYKRYWPNLRFNIKSTNWETQLHKGDLIKAKLMNLNIHDELFVGALVPDHSVRINIDS